jgi:hypothetical protein
MKSKIPTSNENRGNNNSKKKVIRTETYGSFWKSGVFVKRNQ